MSTQFYEKLVSFWFKSFVILILFLGAVQTLLLYFSTGQVILYYAYGPIFTFGCCYALRTFLEFRSFQETLRQGLYFPQVESEKTDKRFWLCGNIPNKDFMEDSDLEVLNDKALEICMAYANGSSFDKIKTDFHLDHRSTVARNLRKGLKKLLKERKEGVRA
jgi:hypothetical protein